MKRIMVMFLISVMLFSTTAAASVETKVVLEESNSSTTIHVEDYSLSTDFYIALANEYKEKFPNANEKKINNMLIKAFKKYDVYFESNKKVQLLALSYADALPIDKVELNPAEIIVFNSNPYSGLLVLLAGKEANNEYPLRYSTGYTDGNADAFRHIMWNVKGSYSTGTSYMGQFATAHENGATYNTPLAKQMDLYNNQIGRTYYINNSTEFFNYYVRGLNAQANNVIQTKIVAAGLGKRFAGNSFNLSYLTATDTLGAK